ncbi:hypothetical protein N0V91_007023 [Didymella pomorum]|uniref:SHSP domain-containing protein n=1 Tax=Didymella pomorum TaxID=749634 RepID=A0A9W9D5Z2_9PLEO|nr:hypothetical protein N0V91_007023 [Didymella pomorum]
MASFNYMNNSAPFWDYIASLEQQGNNHPFFAQQSDQDRSDDNDQGEDREGHHESRFEGPRPSPFDPWSWGHQLFGGPGGLPHRGPPPPPFPPAHPHGPPPPPGPHGPPHHDEHHPHHERDGEKDGEKSDNDYDNDKGEGPSGSGSDGEGGKCHGRHGRYGSRRGRHSFGGRGGCGHHGGPGRHDPRGPGRGPHGHRGSPHEGHFGPPHGHRGPHHHGGPGRRGPWGRGGPFGGFNPFFGGLGGLSREQQAAALFAPLWEAFTGQHPCNTDNDTTKKDNEDFTPEADIFDTPSAYIIHLSLPGAKKEDVGVNWDAEKSELSVAGVIYRPGDEEFLKTLVMNERKVGPFERKIRLGTRANPAHVDAEGITAKLEDGVLRVEVRKEDEGFVEIKKVDIE